MFRSNGRSFLRALPLALATVAALSCAPAIAATVNIYGHIDIGGLPRPPVLVVPTPVIIDRGPVVVEREPVYLHVPPGHRKHWSKHCREYDACGERVYFVQDQWYERVYVPERERRGPPRGHDDRGYEKRYEHYTVGPSGPSGHDRGHGHHDDRDDRDDHHGHKGKGH
ncbi:MAG TPA: hypothetical protein VLC92_08575 [Rhodocyclaceae bacterium]|nr:hypothetical protein [Rhodocyclaceae bacterium]